jgi:hypothetical protein
VVLLGLAEEYVEVLYAARATSAIETDVEITQTTTPSRSDPSLACFGLRTAGIRLRSAMTAQVW